MSTHNPYQPPEAKLIDPTPPSAEAQLAGRWTRLAASIVDSLIGLVYSIPLLFALGFFDYIRRGVEPPFMLTFVGAMIGFVMFSLVHGYLLKTNGQTIGKKLLGIRIVDMNNNVPALGTMLVLRYLPISAVSLIPVVNMFLPLIDVLFIFRADRRTVHDMIAGTKVVTIAGNNGGTAKFSA